MRIVLDTNVLVSGLLNAEGAPGRILGAWRAGALDLVTTEALFAELLRALQYPKIRKRVTLSEDELALFVEVLRFGVSFVAAAAGSAPPPRDPDDAELLGALAASGADWLVTGDRDLLALRASYPILSPAEFVARFV